MKTLKEALVKKNQKLKRSAILKEGDIVEFRRGGLYIYVKDTQKLSKDIDRKWNYKDGVFVRYTDIFGYMPKDPYTGLTFMPDRGFDIVTIYRSSKNIIPGHYSKEFLDEDNLRELTDDMILIWKE